MRACEGEEEEYGPWGEGALKPIRPYREPFSQGPHQQEEGHVHTEIYCSRGYKYSWPYLVASGKCLLPCFPQWSLYLNKTTNFHFQGIISILTQIIGALVLRDSWLCQYGMNAKGLLPGTFALQCIGHQSLWSRQPIAVSDISIYICLIDIRSKSKEQLNERRAGLSTLEPY